MREGGRWGIKFQKDLGVKLGIAVEGRGDKGGRDQVLKHLEGLLSLE